MAAPPDSAGLTTLVGVGATTLIGTAAGDFINGADTLDGGTGNVVLFGFDGADTLYGGAGQVRMNGGNGRDVFVFRDATDSVSDASLSGIDVITGWQDGRDALDFSAFGKFRINTELMKPGGVRSSASGSR
jgi:Ca2+-binding RTX toxin-like protein